MVASVIGLGKVAPAGLLLTPELCTSEGLLCAPGLLTGLRTFPGRLLAPGSRANLVAIFADLTEREHKTLAALARRK